MGCEACRELRTQLVTRRCCVTEFPGQGSTPLQLFRLLYKWREWLAYESEFLGEIGFRNNGIQEFNSCSKSPSLGIVTLLSSFSLYIGLILSSLNGTFSQRSLGHGPETALPGGLSTWGVHCPMRSGEAVFPKKIRGWRRVMVQEGENIYQITILHIFSIRLLVLFLKTWPCTSLFLKSVT